MIYIVLVLVQTALLPIASGAIELATVGGDAISVWGRWWVVWGVGTRLLTAGIAQVSGKGPTSSILGSTQPSAREEQLARELGTANIGMGMAGMLALVPAWALPSAVGGGVFLLIAGLLHVLKKDKNLREQIATWTDLLVGVVVVLFAAHTIVAVVA